MSSDLPWRAPATLVVLWLLPLEASLTDFELTGNIRSGSSGYLRISDPSRPATALRVRTTNDNEPPGSMQVWLVRLE